jgi:hypothetical protein
MAVLGLLLLGFVGKDGLEGGGGERGRGRQRFVEGKFGTGSDGDLASLAGGEGNDGVVELLDARVGRNSEVGPLLRSGEGEFDVDADGGRGAEGVDQGALDDLVTGGNDGDEALAELGVANLVVDLADLSLARAEGFVVEGS